MITFTNHHDNPSIVDLNVQKVWDDSDNGDNLRPISITATLYINGEKTNRSVILNSSNNWSDYSRFHGLDKYDQAGELIDYEIKEEVFNNLTGNAKTGYVDSYETNETTDNDGTTT